MDMHGNQYTYVITAVTLQKRLLVNVLQPFVLSPRQKKKQSDLPSDSASSDSNSEDDSDDEPGDNLSDGSSRGDSDGEEQTDTHLASMHPAVSSGDFGKVVQLKAQRELSDREKFYLLNHHFVPSKGYSFPARTFSQRRRHFQYSWLE